MRNSAHIRSFSQSILENHPNRVVIQSQKIAPNQALGDWAAGIAGENPEDGLNEVQRELVPNKRVRDRTGNNREEDERRVGRGNQIVVKPSTLLQQIHKDRMNFNVELGIEEHKEGDDEGSI